MTVFGTLRRRALAVAAIAGVASLAAFAAPAPAAAEPIEIRISTPAVPGDSHAEMLYVFKEWLERSAPEEFDVQVFLNATLFAQGTEPAAMQRGNLEMALISAQDIAKELPEYSIFTAGYLIRDPDHQQAVFGGPIGEEFYGKVNSVMGISASWRGAELSRGSGWLTRASSVSITPTGAAGVDAFLGIGPRTTCPNTGVCATTKRRSAILASTRKTAITGSIRKTATNTTIYLPRSGAGVAHSLTTTNAAWTGA